MHDYFKAGDVDRFAFVRIPLVLIKSQEFKTLSMDARVLYGLLLDRMCLSIRNEWRDAQGRIYVYYTIKAVCEDICCGQEKACKLMAELENADLIERHRRGQGKPSRIYVKQFSAEVGKSKQFSFEIPAPLNSEIAAEELGESKINHTENKQTEMIYTNPSSSAKTIEEVRDQLDYPLILEHLHGNNALIDAIVSVMVEAMGSEATILRVGGRDVPKAEVVSVLEQLDFNHVEYIVDCMEESRPDVKNIRSYLLTALYNAPTTMEAYYDAKVAHDMGW